MKNIQIALLVTFLRYDAGAQSCNPYFSMKEGIKSACTHEG